MAPTPRSRVPDGSIGPWRVRRAALTAHLAHVLHLGHGVKGMGTDRTRPARNVVAEVVRLWQRLWGIPPPLGASTRPISSPASIAAALPGVPLTLAVVGDFGRCLAVVGNYPAGGSATMATDEGMRGGEHQHLAAWHEAKGPMGAVAVDGRTGHAFAINADEQSISIVDTRRGGAKLAPIGLMWCRLA